MSIFDVLFRGYRPKKGRSEEIPKEEYDDNPYHITIHAVERMNERNITKGQVHSNLHKKPLKKTEVKFDECGRPSFDRYSDNRIQTSINPENRNVVTVHKYSKKKYDNIKGKKRSKNDKINK